MLKAIYSKLASDLLASTTTRRVTQLKESLTSTQAGPTQLNKRRIYTHWA